MIGNAIDKARKNSPHYAVAAMHAIMLCKLGQLACRHVTTKYKHDLAARVSQKTTGKSPQTMGRCYTRSGYVAG